MSDNPTYTSVHRHFVIENDWTEEQLQAMLDRNPGTVNEDHSTNLSHDEWEELADREIELEQS